MMPTRNWLIAALLPLLPSLLPAQQATSSSSGDRPSPGWLVLGTFPVDTGVARLDRDYLGGEAAAAPVTGASAAGKTWREAKADQLGRVDFNTALPDPPHAHAVAYAFTYLTSPADRTIVLAVESDDDASIWLNGQRVYRAEVARGISETDTLTLRVARGVNRLLFKVVNRTGGFGAGARLLARSPDPVGDIAFSTTRPEGALATAPAPWVTLSPARAAAHATLADGQLVLPLEIAVQRWGAVPEPVRVQLGARSVAVPAGRAGEPAVLNLEATWPELVALIARPSVTVSWGTSRTITPFPLQATELLSLLSRVITVAGWEQSANGSDWAPLGPGRDASVRALRSRVRVPEALAGLTLTADVAEFVPGGTIALDGAAVTPDAREQATLCAPCAAGQALELLITPGGDQWWDPPRLRVSEPGWRELADARLYAGILQPGTSLEPLGEASAQALLPLASTADKRAYRAELERLRAPLRALEASVRQDTLDLVGNSHIDAAWLWRWPETVEVTRNTWRTAVKLLDKYPEMKFAASSAKYYTWLEEYEPSLLARIQELQKQGRWIITGGWWVEPDVNTPSGESLVRQGLYGQRTFVRLFGAPATVAWIPDTFGYPWTLPQLFAGAGLTSFITQKLHWNESGWAARNNFFYWEGPDGTRLPTYIPFGYSHELQPDLLAREWRTQSDSAATDRTLTLYGVGDHGGGPTMEMLDRRRDTERVPIFPVLRDADPAASLARMESAAQHPPAIRDELYFEYHRGVQTTQAKNKMWNRRMEALLGAAEAAAVAAGGDYPRAALTTAWQKTLFNQFHDILPGSGIGEVYIDAIADYRAADSIARGVLDASLRALAARMDTRAPVKDGQPYFVFNATSYARSGLLDLPVSGVTRARVLDARGRELPSDLRGDSLRVQVPSVPALGGAAVFVAGGGKAHALRSAGSFVLENAALRVEIDSVQGGIARLYDKRLQRELLPAGARANLLMTMVDTPRDWDAWNIDQTDGPWTAVDSVVDVGRARRTPLGDELTVRRAGPGIDAVQRYFLPSGEGRLDIESDVDWHTSHRLLKAFFPFAVGADSVWAEIPYGAIPRAAHMRTKSDSLKFELPMQRWIDASNGTWGVSLVNDSKHGYDVRGDTLRLSLLRSPKYPDPNADMGRHRFTYSIVPHPGDWRHGETFAAADALNRPLRVIAVDAYAGAKTLPPPLTLTGDGVERGAVKLAEDGETLIVRLVERYGRAATATLGITGAQQWRDVAFVERAQSEWNAAGADGSVALQMQPWQIRTVEVKRGR
ncbi:MAG: alpha-mannosidase [Gemmatimonadetes bacterium]|nr:alpha-mannosidase [Gemmatimonadota bacterium]